MHANVTDSESHGAAIFRLLYDERPIRFKDPDEQHMRALFCRRARMEHLVVGMIVDQGKFTTIDVDQLVSDHNERSARICAICKSSEAAAASFNV